MGKTLKVVYIGNYPEQTGWGNAAAGYIHALDSVGVDVIPRPIRLNNDSPRVDNRIEKLEQKSADGAEVVVQHVLPHLMSYSANCGKNIGLYTIESDNFRHSGWQNCINQMNAAIVPNREAVEASYRSGVEIKVHSVPHAVDVNKYSKRHPNPDLSDCGGNFIFYCIAEFTKRKGLSSLLRAFHMAFSPSEPVSLVIKTSKHGVERTKLAHEVKEACQKIKQGLKLYRRPQEYKDEYIVTQHLSEDELLGLHNACHCYVAPSLGEGFGLPALDALGCGNPVIATSVGGLREFVNNDNGWLIRGRTTPCFASESFPFLETANECYVEPNIVELSDAMREAYSNQSLYTSKSKQAQVTVHSFSYQSIGEKFKCTLLDILNQSCTKNADSLKKLTEN